MKFVSLILFLQLSFVSVTHAQTNDPQVKAEVASYHFELSGGATIIEDGSHTTPAQHLKVNLNLSYFVLPQIELGGSFAFDGYHFQFGGGGYTQNQVSLLLGPIYNLSEKIANSFYLGARAGVTVYKDSFSPGYSYFVYSAFLGKRFELLEHVIYSPEVGINGASGGAGKSFGTSVIPLQISILW